MAEETTACTLHDIQDHGVIGDMATAALIARDGTIDFMCWPRFDSPSVFARLLDETCGGAFSIAPALTDARNIQFYLPDTNVLLTRWMADEGSVEVVDFMRPLNGPDGGTTQLIRRVTVTRGNVTLRVACSPRFDYARRPGHARQQAEAICFEDPNGGPPLRLASTETLTASAHDATAEFTLGKGQVAWFVVDDASRPKDLASLRPGDRLGATIDRFSPRIVPEVRPRRHF